MSDSTAMRTRPNLAVHRSPRPSLARGRIARVRGRAASPRAVATTSRCPSSPGTATSRTSSVPPPSAASARSAAASSAPMSPRFQATRQPPGSSSGNASSTRSARDATARAVTAGQRPRWRRVGGEGLRPDRRGLDRVLEAGRGGHDGQEPGLLGDRLEEQRPRARQRRRERDARVAAARPEVDGPVGPAFAEDSDGGQAVDDVTDRDRGGLADGGQVDRRGPRQQQPGVTVDRGAGLGGQLEREGGQARVEGVGVRGGKGRGVPNARRERLTRSVHTPPVSACHPSTRRRSRRRHRLAP